MGHNKEKIKINFIDKLKKGLNKQFTYKNIEILMNFEIGIKFTKIDNYIKIY